ncbi:CAP domain-containing protein [Actinospongicola halichondriae]|uniref:CAP domain-containing protein n=1 Tax=Actinospongicola halichondriae TaxID=3236844 RepID=UPI003D5ADDE6
MGSNATLAPNTTVTRSRRHRFAIVPVLLAGAILLSACMNGDQQAAFDMINASRADAGVPALEHDETAKKKAQLWAEHLVEINKLEHSNLASGMDDGWKRLGENVGYSTASISRVHDQFMASSGHRANILDRRFTHVGVGVAKGNGRTYVVHVFVQR